MKSVINYTLSHCQKCMKCLRFCPGEAISIQNGRVNIEDEKCINCGRCIDKCNFQGLTAMGSTISDIENYDYTLALIPSALYASCKDAKEAQELTKAIHSLGFDEVEDISAVEGALINQLQEQLQQNQSKELISSFCPVVNRLIDIRYPLLLEKLTNLDYPQEIAAKLARKRLKDKGNVGIFYFCECISKLGLAKFPYGNHECEVDHALSLEDYFPTINHNRQIQEQPQKLSKSGLKSCSMSHQIDELVQVLHVDGYHKVRQVLELAEFAQLARFDYLSCSYCTNGCIGGNLVWGNPFDAKLNINNLIKDASEVTCDLSGIDTSLKRSVKVKEFISIQQRLAHFNQVNQIVEVLPQFDCGACGFASCRQMAEQIVLKNKEVKDCHIFGYNEVRK